MKRIRLSRRVVVLLILVTVGIALTAIGHLGGGTDRAAPPAGAPRTTTAAAPQTQPVPATHGPTAAAPAPPPTAAPSVMTSTAAAADGDAVVSDPADATATITTGPTSPREAALAFLSVFLNKQSRPADQWRATVTEMMTPELAAQFADANPDDVPTGSVAAPQQVESGGDQIAIVTAPITTGDKIRVTLTGASKRWLVSELDLIKS